MMPSRLTGFRCRQQFEYEYQGDVRKRDCGQCAHCHARMKRDIVARAAAEAITSAEVVVFTLTYAPGHAGADDFVIKDISDFLKRERSRQFREARRRLGIGKHAAKRQGAAVRELVNAEVARIVYFGVGERGSRGTKRCHFHLALFYSKPSGFVSSPRDAKGRLVRQNLPCWPKGFVTVDVLAQHSLAQRVGAVRYVAKYFDKTRGMTRAARLSGEPRQVVRLGSNGRAFGSLYIEAEARRTAQAGLPYHGTFYVEGVARSRTHKLFKNAVRGVIRQHAAAAYRDEWAKLRPGRKMPRTDFMFLFDAEFAEDDYLGPDRRPTGWLPSDDPPPPLPELEDEGREGWLVLDLPTGQNVGVVRMFASGSARFSPAGAGGASVWLNAGDLSDVLPALSAEQRSVVERWLAARRPDGWLPPRQRKLEEVRRAAAREAALDRLKPRHPKIAADHVAGLEPRTGLHRAALRRAGSAPGWSAKFRGAARPLSEQEP